MHRLNCDRCCSIVGVESYALSERLASEVNRLKYAPTAARCAQCRLPRQCHSIPSKKNRVQSQPHLPRHLRRARRHRNETSVIRCLILCLCLELQDSNAGQPKRESKERDEQHNRRLLEGCSDQLHAISARRHRSLVEAESPCKPRDYSSCGRIPAAFWVGCNRVAEDLDCGSPYR